MRNRLERTACLILLTMFGVSGIAAHAQEQTNPDYPVLLGQMKVMRAVIDETMQQTFAPPFGLLEKTNGTYLPGFGVVFSLEVNLYPLRVPNPFDPRPLGKEELDKARRAEVQRVETIKKTIPRLLADYSRGLREVKAEDSVAVVVHLFQIALQDDKLPTQLVFQVKKSDLEEYWSNKLSYEQLVARTRVLGF
jgi:hypothetical protein